jgi:hypothetical protein
MAYHPSDDWHDYHRIVRYGWWSQLIDATLYL